MKRNYATIEDLREDGRQRGTHEHPSVDESILAIQKYNNLDKILFIYLFIA